jgi:hypothetical protein
VIKRKQREVSTKFNNRLNSFIEESTSHIVEHARRRLVETIEYNSTIRSYSPEFPWFQFALRLQNKAEEQGIQFVNKTSEITPVDDNDPGPHVYCDVGVDRVTGAIRNVKLGKSIREVGTRARDDARAQDQDWITLFTHKTTKNGLSKLEKRYLSLFDAHRINGSKEMFRAEPIIEWSREVGCLGNTGNLSQIMQHIEV